MDNTVIVYTTIPEKPRNFEQDAGLKYLLSYPSNAAKYLDGISLSAFDHPNVVIFQAMQKIAKKGITATFGIDTLGKLAEDKESEAVDKAANLLYFSTFPLSDQKKGADILLFYSTRIEASKKAQELQSVLSRVDITNEEANEKIAEIKSELDKFKYNKGVAPVSIKQESKRDFLLFDDHRVGTLALGNVYQIAGLPKSGKSKMVEVLTASCLGCCEWGLRKNPEHPHIKTLIFDTEMDVADDLDAMRRINHLAGLSPDEDHFDDYIYYNITEEDDMLDQIMHQVQKEKPDLVILDGLNDLLDDPNDLSTSKSIVKKLNQFAKTSGGIAKPICIVWLLHLNQSEGATGKKAGGHSGSQSTMKVSGGWIVERNEDTQIIKVTNNIHRHQAIEPIYIKFRSDNNIYNARSEAEEAEELTEQFAEYMKQQKAERTKIATQNAAKNKNYAFCVDLQIWDGEPIEEEAFYTACLPRMKRRDNVRRKLNTLIEQGIIERSEEGLLILKQPILE